MQALWVPRHLCPTFPATRAAAPPMDPQPENLYGTPLALASERKRCHLCHRHRTTQEEVQYTKTAASSKPRTPQYTTLPFGFTRFSQGV